MHHLVDIDSILTVEPLAIGDEPATVVDRTDEVELPDQREKGLAHDIDLPERVGVRSFEPLHPLDRRQSDPAEMVADQDSPDRLPVDGELKMILDEPGRAMLPLKLGSDDPLFDHLRDALIMASSPIDQAWWTFQQILGPVSFDGSSCALELLTSLPRLNLAPDQLKNRVFFNSNRWELRMDPPQDAS